MVEIIVSSDQSLCVEFGKTISEEINNKVCAFTLLAQKAGIPGVTEFVPTYRSVDVHYRPEIVRYAELKEQLQKLVDSLGAVKLPPAQVIEVPVLYGGDYGPDLLQVASAHNLQPEEVIAIHSKPSYLIYMMGFLPGFCYLGGLDERIATPRLISPRIKVPAGSVGIAGAQTGIYPSDAPGGWQLIGRTPLRLYDPNRARPILMDAGMRLRFYPIDQREYERIYAEQYPDGGDGQ